MIFVEQGLKKSHLLVFTRITRSGCRASGIFVKATAFGLAKDRAEHNFTKESGVRRTRIINSYPKFDSRKNNIQLK